MDIFKYDVYLGMNYSNKTMEFVLPLSKGNSWDIDKDKLKKCKKQSYNDDAVFFKTIENNILMIITNVFLIQFQSINSKYF